MSQKRRFAKYKDEQLIFYYSACDWALGNCVSWTPENAGTRVIKPRYDKPFREVMPVLEKTMREIEDEWRQRYGNDKSIKPQGIRISL